MGKGARAARNGRSIPFKVMAGALKLAIIPFICVAAAPPTAQSGAVRASPTQSTSAQTTQAPVGQPVETQSPATHLPIPQWQIDAGVKLEFDVASVKPNIAEVSQKTVHANIALGPQDMFTPTGGLFLAANVPLLQYMIFAYKLTPNQVDSVQSQLPKWATGTRYDIEARATGNPTKDQYRLMMQALLADRFKLAIHYETKQVPVYALVLDKPGKLGPQFRQHPADSPCSTATPTPTAQGVAPAQADGFPTMCGSFAPVLASNPGRLKIGARNIPMAMIATMFSSKGMAGVDRPVVDKTGLTGSYDIVIEFTPQIDGPLPPGATFQPDESGPTFLEAMKEQLGLRLDKQIAPVDSMVVDHIEQLSEN